MGKGPDLPTLPAWEADAQEYLNFANAALRRRINWIARVRKHGNTSPAIVLVFENGDRLRLGARLHKYGGGLRDAMHSYDGNIIPAYTKPQLEIIYSALIKASDVYEVDSDADILAGDLNTLLVRCLLNNDHEVLRRPEPDEPPVGATFRAISDFRTANKGRSGHPAERPLVPLFWNLPVFTDGEPEYELWLPRGGVLAFLRALRWVTNTDLNTALFDVGWTSRDLQARAHGDWTERQKARLFIAPIPWEPGEIDLYRCANVPAYHVGLTNAYAREANGSRARNEVGTSGYAGTQRKKGDFSRQRGEE